MKKIKKLKELFDIYKLDGYLIPKNDEYFNEYVIPSKDRLKFISNFSGSAGFAIILKKENYLFVDGRYTIQAQIQSGNNFKIITIPNKLPKDIFKSKKKIKIGYDPKLLSEKSLNFILNSKNIIPYSVKKNLIDILWLRKPKEIIKPFYHLTKRETGQNYEKKISKIKKILLKNKLNYL